MKLSIGSVLRLALPVAAAAVVFVPRFAHAGLESCGNIEVRADAKCQVQTSGGCTAQCEPVNVQATCAAKLEAQCSGECTAQADVSCKGSCTADCQGKCTANPGSFDCKGSCTGSCDADCDSQCAGSASGGSASGSCKATCQANCSAKCDAQCSGTPPNATCEGKCAASCEGSCQAKASASCQIDCQGELRASCEAEVTGGCKARCSKPDGALFCDGQYVDTGDNLQKCVDALNAVLQIKVTSSASGQCSNGTCEGQAEAKATCATSPGDSSNASLLPAVVALGAVVTAVARGRKKRS